MYYKTLMIIWLVMNVWGETVRASGLSDTLKPSGTSAPPVQRSSSYGDNYLFAESQVHAFDSCSYDDFACLSMAASDKHGLEAIVTLHKQLDDDEDGNIDYAESDDFLKEELKYASGAEKRQRAFHKNNDMHISVKELWEAWLKSEVHNWTVEQTTDWLVNNVHLPQYVPNFVQHKVKGANLPRLAVNSANYLNFLGIKDPIHKHKISLKAMDVVLFGPPKDGITWKDITLVLSGIVVLLGSWLAYQQNKKFKNHLNRMNRDMDSLQNSEQALEKLQKQLEEAKQAEDAAISEKRNLERMLQDSKGDLSSLSCETDITQYKEEIKSLKAQLELTQAAFKNSCYMAPINLQPLLQMTYELEQKNYEKKKIAAEKQLQQAREACEKLRKKRSSLIGAFVSTHGKAIDDVDRAIVEARSALNEVTYELQEKSHRWRQIELLCGFPISNNPGLQTLENELYKKQNRLALNGLGVRMNSVDDLDMNDDTGSVYGLGSTSYTEVHHHMTSLNEDETSGSDHEKQDENANDSKVADNGGGHFSFQIGGTSYPEELIYRSNPNLTHTKSASQSSIHVKPPPLPPPTIPQKTITRSLTQEMHVEELPKATKSSSCEGNLETRGRPLNLQEVPEVPKKALIEDDVCSTDSSLIEEGDGKKKKRKLFNFSKKSKKS
ncbi:stromal interaction molecule homolog [Anthonomus grandis grandis]|uniref:stromal interaction molecule homolog n=1 Tax=Anthonomus grandis grandis TaxID=2921223 RepID=UPI0021662D75|nr:stromal interaction molecule homolog [Anthonomus grandis grandis]